MTAAEFSPTVEICEARVLLSAVSGAVDDQAAGSEDAYLDSGNSYSSEWYDAYMEGGSSYEEDGSYGDDSYEESVDAYYEELEDAYADDYQAEYEAEMAAFYSDVSNAYDEPDYSNVAADSPLADYYELYAEEFAASEDSLEGAGADAWYDSQEAADEAVSGEASEYAIDEELLDELDSATTGGSYSDNYSDAMIDDFYSEYDYEESYDDYETEYYYGDETYEPSSLESPDTFVETASDAPPVVEETPGSESESELELETESPVPVTEEKPPGVDESVTTELTADPRFAWEPLSFQASEGSLESALPIGLFIDDLFSVRPDGTSSFSTVTVETEAPLVEATDPELGEGEKTTNQSRTVTLAQWFVSPTEWGVSQSVTSRFSTSEESTDEDGANQDFKRSGEETFTITVINGTTTIVSYSISDTFSYESGNVEGIAAGSTPDTWKIPEEWIEQATPPLAAEEEESEEAEEVIESEEVESEPEAETEFAELSEPDETTEEELGEEELEGEDSTEVLAEFVPPEDAEDEDSESFGARFTSTVSFSTTVTETLVTLPDGRSGRSSTVAVGRSNSFLSLAAGSSSSSSSEGTVKGMTIGLKKPGEEPETDEEETDESDVVTDDAPLIADLTEPEETEAEGESESESETESETESEEAESEDSEFSDAPLEVTVEPGGNGHSVNASASFLTYAGGASAFNALASIIVADGDDPADAAPSGFASFSTGSQSGLAGGLTLNGSVQTSSSDDYTYLSFDTSSSGGGSRNFDFAKSVTIGDAPPPLPPGTPDDGLSFSTGNFGGGKSRLAFASQENAWGDDYGVTYVEDSSASSSAQFGIDKNETDGLDFSFRVNASSTHTERGGDFSTSRMYGNEDTFWLPDTDTVWFQLRGRLETEFGTSDTSKVSYSFGYGDAGLLSDDESIVTSKGFVRTTNEAVNHSRFFDGSEEVLTITDIDGFKFDLKSTDGAPATGSSTITREVHYDGYTDPMFVSYADPPQVTNYPLSTNGNTTPAPPRSQESILEEYRDRSEQVARLQAAIADPNTDPAMISYYQDVVNEHNNILTTLTTEALAAGITQAELNQTTTQAQTTAANDPIDEGTIVLENPAVAGALAGGGELVFQAGNMVADELPGLGQAKGAAEAITGLNVRGDQLGVFERFMAGVNAIPGGGLVGRAAKGGKIGVEATATGVQWMWKILKGADGKADDVAKALKNAPKLGLPIQFGKDANQVYHAFRHIEGVVDKTKAISDITDDLNAAAGSLQAGLNVRKVIVDGVELTYHAFKFPDGMINVGRITIPRP